MVLSSHSWSVMFRSAILNSHRKVREDVTQEGDGDGPCQIDLLWLSWQLAEYKYSMTDREDGLRELPVCGEGRRQLSLVIPSLPWSCLTKRDGLLLFHSQSFLFSAAATSDSHLHAEKCFFYSSATSSLCLSPRSSSAILLNTLK